MISTGASDETKKMNIYDFAGNEWEWTLEKSLDDNLICVNRGGAFDYAGSFFPASYRMSNASPVGSNYFLTFRATIYKK